jgi:AbrB family looped-hinge helix DNA binding protein
MSLVKVKDKFQVTIPGSVRRSMHLEIGDLLEARIDRNAIVLEPKILVDRKVENAISEGIKDIKSGRITPSFSSVGDFKNFLKKK